MVNIDNVNDLGKEIERYNSHKKLGFNYLGDISLSPIRFRPHYMDSRTYPFRVNGENGINVEFYPGFSPDDHRILVYNGPYFIESQFHLYFSAFSWKGELLEKKGCKRALRFAGKDDFENFDLIFFDRNIFYKMEKER